MDAASSSMAGSPLQPVSHNPQRERDAAQPFSHRRTATADERDGTVHDKINQFNSLAMQSKQLERKTADAALKRAMLGREEAEHQMRQYREENRLLKKQLDEGKERERRVGERLETVMENYGRAKETHAHTQALWEKEIRRTRKEMFKSQSIMVKLQEELKSCRTSQKSAEEALERERERSKAREQEAFAARYSLVGLQEQLEQALEKVKMLEQERDAFKTLAKNEEDVARIAAEGKIPLPPAAEEDDEFASPKKQRASSVNIADVKSSASSEAEIDELTWLWQSERQRADRALELVDYLQAECHLKCCAAAKTLKSQQSRPATASSPRRSRASPFKIADAGDLVILSENAPVIPQVVASPKRSKMERLREAHRESRLSTVFVPAEGVFRTVSQQEAEAMQAEAQAAHKDVPVAEVVVKEETIHTKEVVLEVESQPTEERSSPTASEPLTPADEPTVFARTPSVEPPDFAIMGQPRTSLLSLLNAPHQQESHIVFNIPTTPGPQPEQQDQHHDQSETDPESQDESDAGSVVRHQREDEEHTADDNATPRQSIVQQPYPTPAAERAQPEPEQESEPERPSFSHSESQSPSESELTPEEEIIRPHTSAAFYTSTTTTTTVKVPLRDHDEDKGPNLAARLMKLQRTPSRAEDKPSFDVDNPALTPTMTREQALAQIRERRIRARSVTHGNTLTSAITPRKQMMQGGVNKGERRDVSAPAASGRPASSAARRIRT